MVDMYSKLNHDEIYMSKLENLDDKLNTLKLEYNFLKNESDLLEKTYTTAMKSLVVHSDHGSLNYLNIRVQEKRNLSNSIYFSLSKTRKIFYSLLYYPLIQCIYNIKKYHSMKQCVHMHQCNLQVKNKSFFLISQIILFIFDTCNVDVFGYDAFNNWNGSNIYSHPIMRLLDEDIDKNVLLNRSFSKFTAPKWLPFSVFNTLQNLENQYYLVIIKDLLLIVKLIQKQNCNYLFQFVFDIEGIGNVVYSFLLGTALWHDIQVKYCNMKNNRKQKLQDRRI